MKTILFSALMLTMMTSCTTKKNTTTESCKPINNSTWVVSSIDGNTPKSVQTLTFNGEKIEGKGACNAFGGKAVRTDKCTIEISGIMATKMACDNLSEEQAYFDKLRAAKSYSVNENTLVLFNAEGKKIIQFKKK